MLAPWHRSEERPVRSCISLERAAFAVDTHVHRIFMRLGLVVSNGRKKEARGSS